MLLRQFVSKKVIGIVGAASSGKTREAGDYGLTKYLVFPECTTVLVSSTDMRSLELRIWGEIKKHWGEAKARFQELPGHPLWSKLMLATDSADAPTRDYRNSIIGIPCVVGGAFVGISKYIGIKNKNVILLADEAQFMSPSFFDSFSNLAKNKGFQGIAMGNPKERSDALGKVCEPRDEDGGWEGLDQTEKTKEWATRFPDGVCVQLVGTDSPNFDVGPDEPVPFDFLINRESIESDLAFYGRDSLQFSMMNLGMFPKDSVARRVISRSMCAQFGAMDEPIWQGSKITKVGGLDAAYGALGGDRCVFTEMHFGEDISGKQILANIANVIVPVSVKKTGQPEDQIAEWVKEYSEARGIQPANVGYDSTGRGSLGTAFARIWSNQVEPVEFGRVATDRPVFKGKEITCREYYSKYVSELWFSVRLLIESGQFRGLTEELLSEGCMREWKMVAGNRIEIETKDETKKRMGRSPDLFDSLVTAVEMARKRGLQIESLSSPSNRVKQIDMMDGFRQKSKDLRKYNNLKAA